jgi:hypothetical protein
MMGMLRTPAMSLNSSNVAPVSRMAEHSMTLPADVLFILGWEYQTPRHCFLQRKLTFSWLPRWTLVKSTSVVCAPHKGQNL